MVTRFCDFSVTDAVQEMRPARVFLRRRSPELKAAIKAMLREGSYQFIEVSDAVLLIGEVSTRLFQFTPGETLELTAADRETAGGTSDLLFGFRRPAWNRGVILLTALARSASGDETEYGSALVLGPGVAIDLHRFPAAESRRDRHFSTVDKQYKLAS